MTLRVLHVGKFFPPAAGGMETFLRDLTVEQRQHDVDASVIVHHHEVGLPTCEELIDSVPVCRVRTMGTLMYAPVSPTFGRHLTRKIVQDRPDVIHFHLPNASAFLGLSSRAAKRVPWIATWQSDVVSDTDGRIAIAYRFYRPLEQRFLSRCRFILTSSPPYIAGSEALSDWRYKCFAVPLGISSATNSEDDAALLWAQQQWSPAGLRALCIGRLTYYKGHEFLLEAVAKTPGVQLCVAGAGKLGGQIRDTASRLQLGDRARLLGFLDDERLQALLTTCDCLVLPSIERTEAFGLVLLEAMRHGKPLIATSIPNSGPAWIVQQGPSGLVVPPRNANALAGALAQYRDDPQLRERLGSAARVVFAERFSIARVAAEVSDYYRRACEPEAAAPSRSRPEAVTG